MTGGRRSGPADGSDTSSDVDARAAAARRRRLAEVFGDVLPETTSDERGEADGSDAAEEARDRWYREQVPPHHG